MSDCRRFVSAIVVLTFILSTISPYKNGYAAPVAGLPVPGTMVNLSATYAPLLIKGLRVHTDNPLLFDFIVDTGNSLVTLDSKELRTQSTKLIKYFLATLAIPEKNLWVNLSPYEKDRIIEGALGQTELGADMLAQDYVLKQLTASMIYPEKELGKKFWDKVYTQIRERFGANANVPVNTFNKVWILPDQADIYVRNNTALVVRGHLKVMLEEDYLAAQKHESNVSTFKAVTSQVIRQIVLPEIEKEVNEGKNFAPLRQIFNSIILASWYKKNLKEALFNQIYADKSKINGVDANDHQIKDKIYKQYLQAYKKGVFNYIKEDRTQQTVLPRKYFSGGEVFTDMAMKIHQLPVLDPAQAAPVGHQFNVLVRFDNALFTRDNLVMAKRVIQQIPTLNATGLSLQGIMALPIFEPNKAEFYSNWLKVVVIKAYHAEAGGARALVEIKEPNHVPVYIFPMLSPLEGSLSAAKRIVAYLSGLSDRRDLKAIESTLSVDAAMASEGEVAAQQAAYSHDLKEGINLRLLSQDEKIVLGKAMEKIAKGRGLREDKDLVNNVLIGASVLSNGEIAKILNRTEGFILSVKRNLDDQTALITLNVDSSIEVSTAVKTMDRFYLNVAFKSAGSSWRRLSGFGVGHQAELFKAWLQKHRDLFDEGIAKKLGVTLGTVQRVKKAIGIPLAAQSASIGARTTDQAMTEQQMVKEVTLLTNTIAVLANAPQATEATRWASTQYLELLPKVSTGTLAERTAAVNELQRWVAMMQEGAGMNAAMVVPDLTMEQADEFFKNVKRHSHVYNSEHTDGVIGNLRSDHSNAFKKLMGYMQVKNYSQLYIDLAINLQSVLSWIDSGFTHNGNLWSHRVDQETLNIELFPNGQYGSLITMIRGKIRELTQRDSAKANYFDERFEDLLENDLGGLRGLWDQLRRFDAAMQSQAVQQQQRQAGISTDLISEMYLKFNRMVWGRINTKVDKFNSSKIILAEYAGSVPEGHKAVFKALEKYARLVFEIVATENGGTQYVLHLPGGDPESSLIFDLNSAFARVKRELDSAQSATGGIDMNTSKMGMNVTGEKINIQLDNAMIDSFKRGDFTGVRPVILNVTPIQSVLPLLGLAPRREDDELAKG